MALQQAAPVTSNSPYTTLGVFVRKFDVPVDALVTAATDTIELLPILAGETVLDLYIAPIGDMDTGAAALRFTVGDRDDADEFLSAIDPAAGTGAPFRANLGVGAEYSADNAIVLTASVAAGGTAAAGVVRVVALIQGE